MPDGAGMAPSNNEPHNELSDSPDGAGTQRYGLAHA